MAAVRHGEGGRIRLNVFDVVRHSYNSPVTQISLPISSTMF